MGHEGVRKEEASVTRTPAGNGMLYVVEIGNKAFRFLGEGSHLQPLPRNSKGREWDEAAALARKYDSDKKKH